MSVRFESLPEVRRLNQREIRRINDKISSRSKKCQNNEVGNGDEENKYIFVKEMAMNGPVESVFESSPVKDPNPLLLGGSPSQISRRRQKAHLSPSSSSSSSDGFCIYCLLWFCFDLDQQWR